MNKKIKYKQIFLHISFWMFFFLLLAYQAFDEETTYMTFLRLAAYLSVTAVFVYFNLYFLFPKYLEKRKITHFVVFFIITVLVGAYTLSFTDGNIKPESFSNYLQNCINLFFFLAFPSGLKLYGDNIKKQVQIKTLENAKLNTELSLLKSQINPHFLFNSLNNLYGLVLQNKNKIATDSILNLSDLMRYVLDKSSMKKVLLAENIKFLTNYIDLEKIRLPENIDIKFETSLSGNNIEIPPLLFIPMVENAFKHGVEHHTKEGFAHFSLSLQGDELFFEATNSLVPQKRENEKKLGTGLANLRRRLEILFPNKHKLTIEKNTNVFRIVLILNL